VDFNNLFQEIVHFAGTFSPLLLLVIFLALLVSEFEIFIPYLMETIWILTGYSVAAGVITPPQLITMMLVAICGRAAGAAVFYLLVRYSSSGVLRFYGRFFHSRINASRDNNPLLNKVIRRIKTLSPVSVAFGRLFWLRIPLTIMLGIRRQLFVLLLSATLHSVIWDSIYILIGVIGSSAHLSAGWLFLLFLGGILLAFFISFLIRRLTKLRALRR